MKRTGLSEPPSVVSDLLPPVGTRWCDYEKKALEIRKIAGVDNSARFDPESLASILNFQIIKISALDGLSEQLKSIVSSGHWSGAAISVDQLHHDYAALIIINDLQSRRRQRATMMEEICHLLLGHKPSRIDANGRSYDRQVEEEAYAVGAAALLPYKPLRESLITGTPLVTIANRFDVSLPLVRYRIRVLALNSNTDIT